MKSLSITIGDASSPEYPVGVHFTIGVPLIDAIIATTEQIQEHMLEATRGALLPACPGHQHPLQVAERDEVAIWVCPRDPAHYAEPVLPQDTTG
ncbi:zf-TFIIB domain-containing protein [Halopolyspora algeriensis]|uniref:TFIIB-type zinc ribbon-containing protein n=1 Tax=Halopolyspora algeriensis TaxID=1500506 RepID=UPI0011C06331|nr:zf-TFIIB domain-containing protein [Halopolyspora algeriensis]